MADDTIKEEEIDRTFYIGKSYVPKKYLRDTDSRQFSFRQDSNDEEKIFDHYIYNEHKGRFVTPFNC